MRLDRHIAALVSGAATLGAIAMSVPAAWASGAPCHNGFCGRVPAAILSSPTYNSVGEAGYSTAADLAGWRFRYISGKVAVTGKMEKLNAGGGQIGGTGLQLCNPNTGYAVQVGVVYAGGGLFQAEYKTGTLNATPPSLDPCASGGVLSGSGTQLNLGEITVGDQVSFALYYNWRRQTVDIGACDYAHGNNFCPHVSVWVGRQSFYEAGAGVQNVNSALSLSYPADVWVTRFSDIRITGWLHRRVCRGNFRHGPWTTQQIIATTSGDPNGDVFMTPAGSLNRFGGAFNVFMAHVVS